MADLYDTASTLHLFSCTPSDEAYWRGYLTGLRRRMNGGVQEDDIEYRAFQVLLLRKSNVDQALGRGYRDGVAGKAIDVGVG